MSPTPRSLPVTNRQRRVRVTAAQVRAVLAAVFESEGAGEPWASVAIVDDETIREVNREFLDHDWATDALAFSYEDDPAPDGVKGEVMVSAETARREALERGKSPRHELLLYVAHGALHLLGHDDDTPARRTAMNRRAAKILEQLDIGTDLGRDELLTVRAKASRGARR